MTDFDGTDLDGRYRLTRELGRGGMATVWRARDLRHDRDVAVKIIHPELAGAIGVDRFLREITVTAQLQHPGIVPILDSGQLRARDGTMLPWYAMPLLEGESLRERLSADHQLPIDVALTIAGAVADALHAAHLRGVVHRDIKPENIFLAGSRVFVVDFGVAKAIAGSGSDKLTSTGLSIGTPAYMSPEQAFGGAVDARADQYALATVLYEMLAGDPPFGGTTPQSVMARRVAEPARSLIPVRSTVPPGLDRAILRALERTPADRFPDLPSFTAALRARHAPAASSSGTRPGYLAWIVVPVILGVIAWLAVSSRGRGTLDPALVALQQRATRAYDQRTPAGVTEAVSLFGSAIARDSSYAPAWSGLAKSYTRAYQRGFTVSGIPHDSLLLTAIAATDRALALDSTNPESWVSRAVLNGQVDPVSMVPVRRDLERAIALDSSRAETWHFLAVTYAEEGDLAKALELWRRSVRSDPAYTQGLAFLGIGHNWRGRFDSAAYWADSALAVESNYLLARILAGQMALELGDYAGATQAFDAARRVASGPEIANALTGSVQAAARSGKIAEARRLLLQVDSLIALQRPLSIHSAVFGAQAHWSVGNTTQALELLERYQPTRDRHFQLHLRCDPAGVPMRGSPRLRALLITPAPEGREGC